MQGPGWEGAGIHRVQTVRREGALFNTPLDTDEDEERSQGGKGREEERKKVEGRGGYRWLIDSGQGTKPASKRLGEDTTGYYFISCYSRDY